MFFALDFLASVAEDERPLLSKYSITLDEEEAVLVRPTRMISNSALTNKTIVLDMDLTLICTIGDGSDLSQKMRTRYRDAYGLLTKRGIIIPTTLTQFGGSGKAIHNDVVKRPGVDEFLTFCRTVFKHVILWSAGQPSYVYDIVRLVLDPDGKNLFDHVYTSQDVVPCSIDNIEPTGEGSRKFADTLRAAGFSSFSTKPLTYISRKFPDATLEKTVIVDDLPCNFLPNPRNGVLIPPFSPPLVDILNNADSGPLDNMSNDHCLFSLLHFFADETFLKSDDVRDYNLRFFPSATIGR